MNNKELIAELSRRLEWNTQEIDEMLSTLSAVVGAKLVDGDVVCLQGLGQFEVRKKMERIAANPVNGKRYLVPPKLVPVFKPGAAIKNRLKGLEDAP